MFGLEDQLIGRDRLRHDVVSCLIPPNLSWCSMASSYADSIGQQQLVFHASLWRLINSSNRLSFIYLYSILIGTIPSMSCSDISTGSSPRIYLCATVWFHWVLVQWNWMQPLRWCQWRFLGSLTFILLPLLSKLRVIRYPFYSSFFT